MEKIIDTQLSAEDHYEVLDVMLTEMLDKAGVEVEGDILTTLLAYNRSLRIALRLPVTVPN